MEICMVAHIPRSKQLLFLSLCVAVLISAPVSAFTANSLDITVDKSGDATAIFRFTLEGFLENAIPQSMLEEELLKGLSTSSEPPQLISMDRSTASILMKKFANTYDVPTGTEYQTSTMNFNKAQIALQESALSSVVTADFSPATIKVTLPDGFNKQFDNTDVLPSISHIVIDEKKAAAAAAAAAAAPVAAKTTLNSAGSVVATPTPSDRGAIKVVSSPEGVQVEIDGRVAGTSPSVYTDIPAGSHTLRLSKENYEPITKTVTVRAGQTIQVSVFLAYIEPTPTQAAPGFAGVLAAIALVVCGVAVRMRK